MSVTISREKIKELSDKESRQFFYEEHIETGLPVQIRELRKKRNLNQTELAEKVGCDQSNISDWENPNYEYTPQIGTLKRLANAYDVPLIVRFGSWKELLEWDATLSSEKVAPENFANFEKVLTEERLRENEERIAATQKKRTKAKHAAENPFLSFMSGDIVDLKTVPVGDETDNIKKANQAAPPLARLNKAA